MEFLWLKYFQTAAQLESMTKAAEQHMIPQSAMSQTIAKIERELGVKLFDRVGRCIVLNENGQRFLQYVTEALSILDNGISQMRTTEGNNTPISICALQDRGFVNDCICKFSTTNPERSFEVHYTGEKQNFDLCIADQKFSTECDFSEFLFEKELVLAVSAHHPLSRINNITLAEAMRNPLILISDDFPLAKLVTDILLQANITPPATIRFQDPQMVRNCVAAGLGVSLSPNAEWHKSTAENIVYLRLSDFSISRSSYLCWNKSISPSAIEFRDFLISCAQEHNQRKTEP